MRELDVDLVHQRRGGESVARSLGLQMAVRQTSQVVVEQLDELVESVGLTSIPALHEIGQTILGVHNV